MSRTLLPALLSLIAFALPVGAFAQAKPAADAKVAPARPAASCTAQLKGTTPVKVKFTTTLGAFTVEVDKDKAPITADNFLKYVESGHYNGTIFHRVIDGFMVQGGGMTKDMGEKPGRPPIKNESTNGLKNTQYTLAMARTGVRDSASAQFFINVKDNDFLNYSGENPQGWGYAVFGKVVEGTDVIDKMKKVATGNKGMHQNVPLEPIVIEKAECV